MEQQQQTYAFKNDIWKLIDRYNEEFDLEYETMVGSLEIVKHSLIAIIESDEDE